MKELTQAEIIAKNVKSLIKRKGINQKILAEAIGLSPKTLSPFLIPTRLPSYEIIQKIADYFGVDKVDIDSTYKASLTTTTARITHLSTQLTEPRRKKVLAFTQKQILEQLESDFEVHESTPVYTVKINVHSKVSAGLGYGYDDNDIFEVWTDRDNLPRYNLATMVSGNSMSPDYEAGEVLLLCDEGMTSHYDGQLFVVVVNDENYFKEIYTNEDERALILHSLNPDYDDQSVSFPPTEGE